MTLTQEDLQAIGNLFQDRFDGINAKLEKVDAKLDGIDARLDEHDERFNKIDKRFDVLERHIVNVEHDLFSLSLRMEHAEGDIASLVQGQKAITQRLDEMSDKLDATYKFALENWGQIEESKTRLRYEKAKG